MNAARRVRARATPVGRTHDEFAGLTIGTFLALGLPLAAARGLTSLVAIETAYGQATYNGNVGFILADRSWHGAWIDGAELRVPGFVYRAYASREEGAADLIAFLRAARYARAWAMLLAGDRDWYLEAVRAGYTGGSVEDARAAYGNVPEIVGAAWNRYAARELAGATRADVAGGGVFVAALVLTAAAGIAYASARR